MVSTTAQPPKAPAMPANTEGVNPATGSPAKKNGNRYRRGNNNRNKNFNPNNNRKMNYGDYQKIAKHIEGRTEYRPKVAIICGSGLGPLAGGLENSVEMTYESIPGFPRSTVVGHEGKLVFGTMDGIEVVAMKGRFHPYEGYPLWKVASPIRVFKCLGISHVIVSNAAGGLNPDYKVGDVMIIKDHINFMGFANQSPLQGMNIEEFGPRFPPISKAYTPELRKIAKEVFAKVNADGKVTLREGVYTGLGGPTYETIAESKFLLNAGCDAVGMSTTQEVIVAAHCGIKVLGMSLITNEVVTDYDNEEEANHEEVIESGKNAEKLLTQFAVELVKAIAPVNES